MFDFFNGQKNPFMQQMFMMQMQMAQNMMMLPMQFMQNMMNMMNTMNTAGSDDQKDGFSLGGMNISPEMLKKLMQMDMTPENLEKLQKVLDFVFETMPEPDNK